MRLTSRLLRGFGAFAALLCALLLGVYGIASSADYKGMVDSMLGGTSAKAGSSDTYAYTSDYDTLEDMLTERVRIAEQLGEEGCVLLKNDNGALPLGNRGESEVKVTVLGNRPYTYKTDGTLRDTRLTFYGGITGSRIYEQTVTIKDENGISKTIASPVTLETAFANEKIIVNPAMRSFYSNKPYSPFPAGSEAADAAGGAYSIDEPMVTLNDVANRSEFADACFVVIGRTSGEGRDYLPGASGVKSGSTQKSALGLSAEELNLIDVADQIAPGKVIVLINSAVTMEIDELKNDERVNSILWIGLPGCYALNGVARVISGKASPSGKLSDTYAVEASMAPAAQNFGNGDPNGTSTFSWSNGSYTRPSNGHYVVMAEGIYTGYYYYETRYNDVVLDAVAPVGRSNSNASAAAGTSKSEWKYEDEVSYTFGYGLSYTDFTQEIVPDSLKYSRNASGDVISDSVVSLDVKVTNTGAVPAKDVVTLYVQTPYTERDRLNGIEKSAIQLVAFAKTDTLDAGQSQTLTINAEVKYFASYDQKLSHDGKTGGYMLDEGTYYFGIGNGAHEALNNILAKQGISEDALYIEDNSSINAAGAYAWDIASQRTPDSKNNSVMVNAFSFSGGIDSTTFSRSENGTLIENQMQDADYNHWVKDAITYLSRKDWSGTFPKSYTKLATVDGMSKYLAENASVCDFSTSGTFNDNVVFGVDHSEEEDENTGVPLENTDIASYKGRPYDDPVGTPYENSWDYLLQQISFDEAWQFAPLGGTKCEPFRSVNAPEVWQIDGPNGNLTRGYSTLAPTSGFMAVSPSDPNANYMSADMPCAPMIGATFNAELIAEEGDIYAEDNLWSRNPIMWAPGMNLHRCAFNSRNHEYYSEDPILTNVLGTAFVRAGVAKGSILSAKHFAFNSQESYREGLCQFFNEQAGREMELRAFQGLCEDVNYIDGNGNRVDALGLMSTFSRVGVCGANGHTGMMKNILRGEWGYKGLISTDMVSRTGFFNPQDCVMNNVTFMATSSGESFLASAAWAQYNNKQLVKNSPELMNGLYENMHYYMYALANSCALNGYAPGDVIIEALSWWQVLLIALSIVFGVAAVILIALSIVFYLLKKKNKPQPAGVAALTSDGVAADEIIIAPVNASASTDDTDCAKDGGGSSEPKEESPPDNAAAEPLQEQTDNGTSEQKPSEDTPIDASSESAATAESAVPAAKKPSAAKSATTKPSAAKSTVAKSTAAKSTTTKSAAAKTTATKSTAAKSTATKSTTAKSAAKKPAVKNTAKETGAQDENKD